MRLILIDEGIGNLKYRSGYEISNDVIREFQKVYIYNPLDIRWVKIKKEKEENLREYYKKIEDEASKGPFVSIGGDHSVTWALYKPFKKYPIISFDAHPDLEISTGFPTHEDWLRLLIEDGILDGKDVYLIGVRNFSENEIKFIKENDINILFSNEIQSYEDILDFLPKKKFYVTIDIDVFDPAFAPGTYYREPFGLNPKDILNAILELDILSGDITEINKDFDMNNMTVRLSTFLSIYMWKRILGE